MPRIHLDDDRWSQLVGDIMIVPGAFMPSLPSAAAPDEPPAASNEPTPAPEERPVTPIPPVARQGPGHDGDFLPAVRGDEEGGV